MVILVIILVVIIIFLVKNSNAPHLTEREKLIKHINDVMYNTVRYAKNDCPPNISQVDFLSEVLCECFLKYVDEAPVISVRKNMPIEDYLAIIISAYDRNVKLFNLNYVPF